MSTPDRGELIVYRTEDGQAEVQLQTLDGSVWLNQGEMSRAALQAALGLSDRKSFRERYLQPALADGLIAMTIPDKPNSRLQKYRLTAKGQWQLAHIRLPQHPDTNLNIQE